MDQSQASNQKQISEKMSSWCAACKYLGRRCRPQCSSNPIFEKVFGSEQEYVAKIFSDANVKEPGIEACKFEGWSDTDKVEDVFGADYEARLLGNLNADDRKRAFKALAYDADVRLRNPFGGVTGLISVYMAENQLLKSLLAKYNASISTTATKAPPHQY